MTRRAFVQGQTSQVSAPLAFEALNTRWDLAQAADFGSDIDVLNYALTLEYLEAAFYEQGNKAALLSGKEKEYLATIQADEETHVKAITATIKKLGGTPVAKPMVEFGDAFASRDKYLTTSHTFENVGGSLQERLPEDLLEAGPGDRRHAERIPRPHFGQARKEL